jgi:hypothetical protein
MKKIYILLIISISYFGNIFCQNNIEIEISEGFVFFDYFGNIEPKGYEKVFAGYGLQTEFDLWKNVYNHNSMKFKVGIGYTNFYYLYDYGYTFISEPGNYTSYANLKLGLDYKPKWSKLSFIINSTNYFLLHKKKQRYSQNRWFNNLDLGIKFKLIKNIYISFWSPITLYPMHNGEFLCKPVSKPITDFDPFIEITGLNLGIRYKFGG